MPQRTTSAQRALTDFEQTLLGLIGLEPRSGYELKRLFSTTPAGVYQPSDGALYPALRRLEHRGYLTAERTPTGRRERRLYRATAQGRTATLNWIKEPVDPTSVGRDLASHLMKFVLMEDILSPAEVRSFLADLAAALEGFLGTIGHHIASADYQGRHPRLALEHGLAVQEATLDWVRHAIATLEHSPDPEDGEVPRLPRFNDPPPRSICWDEEDADSLTERHETGGQRDKAREPNRSGQRCEPAASGGRRGARRRV